MNSPDPQAIRPPDEKANFLLVTLPTNFKCAKFDDAKSTAILRQLEKDVDAARFDTPEGKIELPVKFKVYDLIFVPLAKWAMLLAGNYRCVTKDGMRTAQEAVHSDLETARSVYNFVNDLCVKLGAKPDDLVPFEKYAAAAQSLTRPASAARALQNGAPNIERADKLVQLIAKQKGLSHPAIDAQVALVDARARSQSQEAGGLGGASAHFDVLPEAELAADLSQLRPRRFVAPRGALMPRAFDDDVVELHAVRTGPVIGGFFRLFEPSQAHRRAREVLISLAFHDIVALRNDLAVNRRLHDFTLPFGPLSLATMIGEIAYARPGNQSIKPEISIRRAV